MTKKLEVQNRGFIKEKSNRLWPLLCMKILKKDMAFVTIINVGHRQMAFWCYLVVAHRLPFYGHRRNGIWQ